MAVKDGSQLDPANVDREGIHVKAGTPSSTTIILRHD